MRAAGIESRFVQGRRYTDAPTREIVEQVLTGEVNSRVAGLIEELGGRSMTLNFESTNVLTGKPLEIKLDGESVDLGFVGQVTQVNRMVVENLCYAGQIPIIPSMCVDEEGNKYNVNADTAATAVAQSLRADKLVFLSDVNGVRRDKDDPDTLIHTLTPAEARELIAAGAIDSGMIPKVEACIETLNQGVRKVHIIDGRLRHSLMLEIYTTEGIGTQLIASRD
jgi:acetylglutamate kinase